MASDEDGPSAGGGEEQNILDEALRNRVEHAMRELKRTLDAALARPTTDNLHQLRDATDGIMRASARVLIELGRGDGGESGLT